jgi:hypothetical protein
VQVFMKALGGLEHFHCDADLNLAHKYDPLLYAHESSLGFDHLGQRAVCGLLFLLCPCRFDCPP